MPDGKGGRRTENLWVQDRFAENGVRDAGAAALPLPTEKEDGGQETTQWPKTTKYQKKEP